MFFLRRRKPFLLAADAVIKLKKHGVRALTVQVGVKCRIAKRPKPAREPQVVIVKVDDEISLEDLDMWCVYPPEACVPVLHNPYVYDERCLQTFERVREAGFPQVAKHLISVPIELVCTLRPEQFEKRGVLAERGVEVQNALAKDRKPQHVMPIGLLPELKPEPVHFQTTRDFLQRSNFAQFAPSLQAVPINRVEMLGPEDFGLLRIPNWVGMFIQRTLKAANSPEHFTLF
jgi:hypothetical protein